MYSDRGMVVLSRRSFTVALLAPRVLTTAFWSARQRLSLYCVFDELMAPDYISSNQIVRARVSISVTIC